jgi:hypothetical protein
LKTSAFVRPKTGCTGYRDTTEVIAVLPISYLRDEIKSQGKKQRKALSEVAYREQWGQPFV